MNYVAMAQRAREAFRKNGVTTTLRRVIPGAYDPVTGISLAPTTLTQVAYALVVPSRPGGDETFKEGSLIRQRRRKLFFSVIAAPPWEPEPADEILIENTWWKLPGFSVMRPDGKTPLYYEAGEARLTQGN